MSRQQLDALLDEIREARDQALPQLIHLTEADFPLPTAHQRRPTVRNILLGYSEHMREHGTHMEGTRALLDRAPTMPQRMLAEAEEAWGRLLGTTVGLTDADLETVPSDGGWSVRQILDHLLSGERRYLDYIQTALRERETTSGEGT